MSTPAGFDGTMAEASWSQLAATMSGFPYTPSAAGDWVCTKVSGADRTVQVTGSKASLGWGISSSPATATVQLDSTTSTRWDLVCWIVDWTKNTWTLGKVKGSDGVAAAALPSYTDAPGTGIAYVPIALCQVVSGQQLVQQIIDVRTWVAPRLYAQSLLAAKRYQRPGMRVELPDGTEWESDGTNLAQVKTAPPFWVGASTSWSSGYALQPGVTLVPHWTKQGGTLSVGTGNTLTLPAGMWSASLQMSVTGGSTDDAVEMRIYMSPGAISGTLLANEPSGRYTPLAGSSNDFYLAAPTDVAFGVYNTGTTAATLWSGGNKLTLIQLGQI